MKTSSSFWTTVEGDNTGGTYRAEITTDFLDFQFLLTSNHLSKESSIKVWVNGMLCKTFENVPYSDDQTAEHICVLAALEGLTFKLSRTVAEEVNRMQAGTTNRKANKD